jgi:hypothetical protein
MSRTTLTAAVLIATGIVLSHDAAPAAGKKASPKSDPGSAVVEKVLRAEVAGQVDRRNQLAGALQEVADSHCVHWQAGFVREGNVWRSFDEFSAAGSATAALTEYQSRRFQAEPTFAGQLGLADWCRKQGLADQERAHLNAALASAPPDRVEKLQQRLGWRQVGGVWFTRDDLLEWQRINKLTATSLQRWEAKLNQIAKGLSGSARQRDVAAAALAEIKDPSAVPAIELTLTGHTEAVAQAAVAALGRITGPDSSVALARQAMFSQWPEVRLSAATALKPRILEDFVPPLISLLATPVKSEWRVTAPLLRRQRGRGQFVILVSLVLSRETENQFQVAAFRETNLQINEALNGMTMPGERANRNGSQPSATSIFLRASNDVGRATAERVAAQQQNAEEVNAQTAEMNGRVGAILAVVSGKDPSSDPHVWWDWWKAQSDTELAGGKQTVVVSEEYLVGDPQAGFRVYECLAAGTPVWTEQGLLAIEKIAVGDRVLSQDVETGELGFKPVLRTTIRPPKELWTVRFNDESLVMTGGHHLWSSGGGWVKSRDLESQALLHTVTGNTPVWTAKKGETAQTYNLDVADFHTYFVGKTGILSHDVLTPRGTNNLVPGLSRMNATAVPSKK